VGSIPTVSTSKAPRNSGAPYFYGVDLAVDRIAALEVLLVEDASFGADTERGPRSPHRHDYHELIWTRSGDGHHLIDGEVVEVRPNTITLIGRGQVHVFERASGLYGAVVRFGDELLLTSPRWLLGSRSARTVAVPPGDAPRLEATIESLAAEARRPPDSRSLDLQRHFLSALLLWVERWYEATRTQQRDADDAELQLYRRFADVLERDFARHHDARHYAEELRVPQAALSRALTKVTGRGTKELITDRRMLEAARLLRFTDLTVGEIAFRAGFGDRLYFSRAFKRHHGEAPMAYRELHRSAQPVHTNAARTRHPYES
jgi:AraC family transcriptional activator of pobA